MTQHENVGEKTVCEVFDCDKPVTHRKGILVDQFGVDPYSDWTYWETCCDHCHCDCEKE